MKVLILNIYISILTKVRCIYINVAAIAVSKFASRVKYDYCRGDQVGAGGGR